MKTLEKQLTQRRSQTTNELAKLAIEAHGGLERWKRLTTVSVHVINGGVLWGAKGKAGVLADVTVLGRVEKNDPPGRSGAPGFVSGLG